MLFNTGLTHLGSEASNCHLRFVANVKSLHFVDHALRFEDWQSCIKLSEQILLIEQNVIHIQIIFYLLILGYNLWPFCYLNNSYLNKEWIFMDISQKSLNQTKQLFICLFDLKCLKLFKIIFCVYCKDSKRIYSIFVSTL